MRTEVNTFFAVLFVCSFICSVAFMNEKNDSDFNSMYKANGESVSISSVASNEKLSETYETVASPSSDTSSMHGKIGEFEVYHKYVNVKTINLKQKYPPLPTRFFHSNEKKLFYKINEHMSYDFVNTIGYFSTYSALERHYLERNSSR